VNKGNDTDRQGVVKKTVLPSGAVFFSYQVWVFIIEVKRECLPMASTA
jgi:hypothetical protein